MLKMDNIWLMGGKKFMKMDSVNVLVA